MSGVTELRNVPKTLTRRVIFRAKVNTKPSKLVGGLMGCAKEQKAPEPKVVIKTVEVPKKCPPVSNDVIGLSFSPESIKAGKSETITVSLSDMGELKDIKKDEKTGKVIETKDKDFAVDVVSAGSNKRKSAFGIKASGASFDAANKEISFTLSVSRGTTPDKYEIYITDLKLQKVGWGQITVEKADPFRGGRGRGPCNKFKDQLSKKEVKDCNTKCKPIRNKTQQKKCVARFL